MASILDRVRGFLNPTTAAPFQRVVHPGRPERQHVYPLTGLTPAKLKALYRAADADGDLSVLAELWEEIEQADGRLGGVLMTRKLALTGLDLTFRPPRGRENDPRAADAVDLCQSQWDHLTDGLATDDGSKDSEHPLVEMGGALLGGYALFQLVWERDGLGAMRIARLNRVSNRRLRIGRDDHSLQVVLGDDEQDRVRISEQRDQWAAHVYRAAGGIPSRYGLGRTVGLTFVLKSYALKDWAVLSEVFGMPLRVARFQPGATSDEKAELLDMLSSLGSDTYAIFSANVQVEFIEAVKNGAAGSPQPAIIEAMDRVHTIAVLGQTLTTDAGDVGSYALGQVHERVRGDLVESDAVAAARTIRRDICAPLVRLNMGESAPVPECEFVIPENVDLTALATQIRELSQAGMEIPDGWVRQKWGMPEVEAGQKVLRPIGAAPAVPATVAPRPAWQPLANAAPLPDAPDSAAALDRIVAAAVAAAGPALGNLAGPIREAIANAMDFDDLRRRLAQAAGRMDETTLAAVYQSALTAAAVQGRAEALAPLADLEAGREARTR